MRKKLLPVVSILAMLFWASCTTGADTAQWTKTRALFGSRPAYACYGAMLMLVPVLLWALNKKDRKRQRRRNKPEPESRKPETGTAGNKVLQELEQKLFALEFKLKERDAAIEQLNRRLAESEQFARTAERTEDKPSVPAVAATTTLYFLQPAKDRFLNTGKVGTAAEALYELVSRSDKPAEAQFTFIDTPQNVSLALPNEANWILVACERSSMPGAQTRSIRTDVPGIALLRNGEWTIVQKAKITYV